MNTTKIHAEGVAQALTKGHCTLCALLLKFQDRLMEDGNGDAVTYLCNHHAWIVAKAAPADKAARIFIRLIERPNTSSNLKRIARCIFCERLQGEEEQRLKEMTAELMRPNIRQWIKSQGTLCVPHSTQLIGMIPPESKDLIHEVLNRNRLELRQDLLALLTHLEEGDRTG